MKTLKRRLILLAITAAFIAFMGGATHSPPSVIDAVTGATRKSKKNTSEYNGSYIIGINTEIAEKSEIIAICSGIFLSIKKPFKSLFPILPYIQSFF